MNPSELQSILDLHEKWKRNEPEGVRADFSFKEIIGADFSKKDLSHVLFVGSRFVGSSFVRSSFDGSSFRDSSFRDSSFVRSSFVRSSFVRSSFDGSSFRDSSFVRSSFVRSSFVRSSFDGSSFRDSSFVRSSFVRSSFDGSSFRDSSFRDSSFRDSSFVRSSFDGSSFRDSSFRDSSFVGSSFRDSSFDGRTIFGIYSTVGGIGECGRQLLLICAGAREDWHWVIGCFRGNEAELRAEIQRRHGENEPRRRTCVRAVDYLIATAEDERNTPQGGYVSTPASTPPSV